MLAFVGAAQSVAPLPHPDVPATMEVAGLHLVLNEEARRLVQQKADALCRHQASFQARVTLADASFPLIDKVLQQEGVPLDFRYLALQESALQGNAQSPHGAVGYWQLKRETATELGLVVNEAVDERQHLTASTRAAARYLVRSNAGLNNWLNTMLSYYTGLGGVKPYTLPTDVGASEMNVTEQTAPYVLMFLAQKVAYEPACGLNPNPPLRLSEFPAMAGQTLAQQARTIYADSSALIANNHWLLARTVPADQTYTLIVPVTDAAQAAGLVTNQRLNVGQELLTSPTVNSGNRAEVRVNNLRTLIALPNENLADMARRGNQRLGTFLRNNELKPFDTAISGRPYYLESKRDVAAVEYHVLQPGETIADVAQRYGIRQRAILGLNRLRHNDELRPGRVLWLQHVRPHDVAVEYRSLSEGAGLESAAGSRPVAMPTSPTPVVAPLPVPAKVEQGVDEATENLNDLLPLVLTPVVQQTAPALPEPAPEVSVAASKAAELPLSAPPAVAPVAEKTQAPPSPAIVIDKPITVSNKPATTNPAEVSSPAEQHTVQAGETIYALARQYNLRPGDLLTWNELAPNSGLRPGQVLRLTAPAHLIAPKAVAPVILPNPANPKPATYVPANQNQVSQQQHIVVKGETLYSIAKRYGCNPAQLITFNGRANSDVRVGELLKIPTK